MGFHRNLKYIARYVSFEDIGVYISLYRLVKFALHLELSYLIFEVYITVNRRSKCYFLFVIC